MPYQRGSHGTSLRISNDCKARGVIMINAESFITTNCVAPEKWPKGWHSLRVSLGHSEAHQCRQLRFHDAA